MIGYNEPSFLYSYVYARSYTKLRTSREQYTYNYTGIAKHYSYNLSASSVRYARRLWLRRVAIFLLTTEYYAVQVQIVTSTL